MDTHTCLCEEHPLSGAQKLMLIAGAIACVLMAGLVSGLTLGLMSIDSTDIEVAYHISGSPCLSNSHRQVIKRAGTAREKQYAKKIEPLIARPHLLLVTLLVCNALCAEVRRPHSSRPQPGSYGNPRSHTQALPIFLDRLLDPLTAIILSVTVVLVFGMCTTMIIIRCRTSPHTSLHTAPSPGEIVPQALCTRFGMAIGAYSSWLVRALIWICWIVAFPISKILDYMLGHGQTVRHSISLWALLAGPDAVMLMGICTIHQHTPTTSGAVSSSPTQSSGGHPSRGAQHHQRRGTHHSGRA